MSCDLFKDVFIKGNEYRLILNVSGIWEGMINWLKFFVLMIEIFGLLILGIDRSLCC